MILTYFKYKKTNIYLVKSSHAYTHITLYTIVPIAQINYIYVNVKQNVSKRGFEAFDTSRVTSQIPGSENTCPPSQNMKIVPLIFYYKIFLNLKCKRIWA